MSRKNGHARPFGLLSRFFREEDLDLAESVDRLRRVPEALREIRLAVERGELCPEDLAFDPDEADEVEPATHPERKP